MARHMLTIQVGEIADAFKQRCEGTAFAFDVKRHFEVLSEEQRLDAPERVAPGMEPCCAWRE